MRNFNNLPTEIILEIITRLPTEFILDCKLVSKLWRNLISHHPSFIQMHLTRVRDPDNSGKLSFLVLENFEPIQYFEYNEDNDQTPVHTIRRINFTPPFSIQSPRELLGSFNGLVCLHGRQNDATYSYCICNPVTKEYVVIPNFNRDMNCYQYLSSGYGFDSLTNEYKVVELVKSLGEPNVIEAAVYTLGSGKGWRNGEKFDTKFVEGCLSSGVFANGAFHWVDIRGTVFVFSLNEEKFHKHVSPPPSPQDCELHYYNIGVFGGVLYHAAKYSSQITHCICYDIWLLERKNSTTDMKEQGEDEPLGWRCWSEEFILHKGEPLAFTKSGGILGFDHSSIYIYDPISLTSDELVDFSFCFIIPHMNTLISLKELGEEDVRTMASAELRRHKRIRRRRR